MPNKDFMYIALTKEAKGWKIGTFDDAGVVEEAECSNIDGMVNFIISQYGMASKLPGRPAEVRRIPGNILGLNHEPLLGFNR